MIKITKGLAKKMYNNGEEIMIIRDTYELCTK